MIATWVTPFTAICIAASLLVSATIAIRRRKQDLRQYLEPPLQQCGVEFISAARPSFFRMLKASPFPKVELETGRPVSNVAGIQGEYMECRVVRIRVANGGIYDLWALVEFEVFKFRRVRWRAVQKDGLPPNILTILEN